MRAGTRTALAMFEALNAIDPRYRSYLGFEAGDRTASQDAAAATAAARVLVHHFPAQKAAIEDSYALAMAGIKDEAAREAGRAIGEKAAAAAIAAGGINPAVPQEPYRPRTTPGEWVATSLPSLEPVWTAFRPWAIPSVEALRPPPPVALNSERWAKDYDEVRRLGGRSSTERTPYQTLVARYRQAFDTMPSMRQVADAPGRTPVQNARMFAVYQMAFDDAAQAMVAAKLHYNFWRPITAIRNGAGDGNDKTQAEPGWLPLLPTPNFQEYPCGHCTVAAAIAEVMTAEVGNRPANGVRVMSLAIPTSVVQALPSWDEWAQEVSNSRIYGGVHYRFSNEAGEQIGRRAARIVLDTVMQPLPKAKGKRRRGG
jgi:PAP2 superfamily